MATAQEIVYGLEARGIPSHIAVGIVSRMAAESRLDPGINEAAPVVPGSRGGYGLNQWTGPRRRQYEQFAANRGVRFDDLDAQLDFTVWELANTEKAAGDALLRAQTPEEAARIYMERFLRPGIPHRDMREGRTGQPTVNALASPQAPQPTRNALAAPLYRYNALQLDPNAFRMT